MKNLFNTIFLCALLALAPAAFSGRDGGYAAFAQNNVTVTGTVVDELGEPLLGAGIVVKILEHFDDALSAILIGNNLANIGASALASVLVLLLTGRDALTWLATLNLTILLIIFG